jgi:hypothetical protein
MPKCFKVGLYALLCPGMLSNTLECYGVLGGKLLALISSKAHPSRTKTGIFEVRGLSRDITPLILPGIRF